MRESTAILWVLLAGAIGGSDAAASEVIGYVAVEGTAFFNDARFVTQERDNASLALQLEFYQEWQSGSSFTMASFARLASDDSRRSHFDLRELNYLWVADRWEVRVGIGKVFWGATEFVHLVDIINQTDLVENIDEEDKLGQPMLHLSVPGEKGVIDLFVLPYFRERTFPGRKGRMRSSPVVTAKDARYESSDEERHVDLAVRYSNSFGDLDVGLYHFRGTGREPTLLPGTDEEARPVLVPFYELINQTGIDLQLVAGEWLLKLESLYRTGQGDGFFSASVASSTPSSA